MICVHICFSRLARYALRSLIMTKLHFRSAILVVLLLLVAQSAFAQRKSSGLTKFGVDFVFLETGERLRGAILGQTADGAVRVVVNQKWLSAAYPKMHQREVDSTKVRQSERTQRLKQRIDKWKNERAESRELVSFLNSELKRIDRDAAKNLEPDDERQFLVLEVPKPAVRRVYIQPTARKQMALVAWSERLGIPETMGAADLAKLFKREGIDLSQKIDLSDRIPAIAQSETEWSARKALVEYEFHKKLDFQGTGDAIFRTDAGAEAPNMEELFQELMQQQMKSLTGGLLGELNLGELNLGNLNLEGLNLGDLKLDGLNLDALKKGGDLKLGGKPQVKTKNWLDKATSIAKQEDVRGFRVTRVEQDIARKSVAVTSSFYARMADGAWRSVADQVSSANANEVDPEIEARIKQDPRISKLIKQIGGLGIGGIEQKLNEAMRFGAATMQAQQEVDSQFFEFRDQYLRQLDSPALNVKSAR